MTILVDSHEPELIEALIKQVVPTHRLALNPKYADYMWHSVDGHRIQIERKQIGEILSGMGKIETQLRREIESGVEETLLLYEGDCKPVPKMHGSITQAWQKSKKGNIIVPGREYHVSYAGFQAWLSQLDKAGITSVKTMDMETTAYAIVALYNNSLKLEHTTLNRYVKEHIVIKGQSPYVHSLMGLKNAGVGEERAKALVERFGTPWNLFNQDDTEIAATLVSGKMLGLSSARKILTAIGR